MHRKLALPLVLVTLAFPGTARAAITEARDMESRSPLSRELEIRPPRAAIKEPAALEKLHGVYRVDRWDSHHFDWFEVAAAVQPKLAPHANKALAIEAPTIAAGGRMLAGFGAIKPLPQTVRLTLSFLDPQRRLSKAEKQHIETRIKQLESPRYRERQQAHDELARLDAGILPLLHDAEDGAQTLELLLRLRRVIEAIEFGPSSGATKSERLQRINVARKLRLKLTITNLSANELTLDSCRLYVRLENGLTGAIANLVEENLGPGQHKVAIFEFEGFEPYECECFARLQLIDPNAVVPRLKPHLGRSPDLIYESNALRLDGLIAKSEVDQGLLIDLARVEGASDKLRVSMRNRSDHLLRIALEKNADGWDLSRHVLYYDCRGQLIIRPVESKAPLEYVILPTNGALQSIVQAPANAVYARVAFSHPYAFTRSGEPRNLPQGVYSSAALVLVDDEESI